MTQAERRLWLIKYLLDEQPQYEQMQIPKDEYSQKRLLRALFNVRMPVVAGDITTIRCDAIVNAANSQMLGCFCPNHGCIDNDIHTYAGIQLRQECDRLMRAQGHEEATGAAKITPAFNLPCKYVIHTVGPVVVGKLTRNDNEMLESCYRSCLRIADENNLKSIAFCCISTGEFHFPNDKAAKLAISTVKNYKEEADSKIEVIFNVFKDEDYEIYRKFLC